MATTQMRRFKGKAMRLTLEDVCGAVVHGPASTVVSSGFIKVTLHPNYENNTSYLIRNANDELEINEEGLPLLRWWDATLEFVRVDPALVNLITGAPLVLDDAATPNVIGWRSREGVTNQFGLEGWTDLAGAACVAGTKSYGYWLLPFMINGQLGDVVVENAAATFTVTAHTHNSSPWGVGPYNVRNNVGAVASPLLTPINALDHFHTEVTTLAPPVPTIGAVLLP
jgi:hypothetical protein